MAYYSKYTGAELEERLDKVEEIPQLIAQMITGKDFVTKEDLLCVLKDYAPADYRTIPIDNNTIYWENGVLKAATSEGGQCQWELREHNGIQYLYSRLPVVTQYDVTMYADVNRLDLPSIYDGLPIDGDTIYWEETEDGKVLKAKSVGGSGENIDAGWVISVISNAGFATQNWVNNQNFINSSLLYSELAKYVKIKDYQEIEGVKNFLNGLQIANIPITKLQDDVLYIDSNVVIRGGLTMYYEEGEIDLPTIKDEIGNAGYDGVTGLASFNSSQFFISNDGTVTIIGGSTGLDTAQLKDYLDSNKYTTETWVKEQGYASASSLSSLQTKVNNFLEGSDTDTIINKWKELEAFLSGLSESDNLAAILGTKANQSALDATNAILATKWTTDNNLINKWNTAYGWGDHSKVGYALKSYVDDTFVTIKGNENVTGVHDFVNGLKIGNIKLSKSQDGVLYLEGNLVVKGGVTMYALDEVTVDSIIDSLPLASTSQYGIAKFNPSNFVINEDGFVTIIGGSSGLDTEELAEYLATNKYVTQGWVEGKGYITSSALNGYATQSWVTNQKYITGITSAMVVSALGYTPFNNASFTKSNIKSTLGISDWALASSKPSYNFSEIGTKPTTLAGYGITDAYTIQQADALYAKYLPLTGGTLSGDLVLKSSSQSSNTPKIVFLRGTSTDNYYDSYIYNNGGSVTFGISYNGTAHNRVQIGDKFTRPTSSNSYAIGTDELRFSNIYSVLGNYSGEVSMQSANINGGKITYDATNKYWKLEGDLLVTGGVSMYSDDSEFTPSTIMDGVVVDGTSIRKNPTTGALEVIGGSGATVKYPLSWSGFNQGSYDGSVAQSFYIPTKLSEFVNDRSFATTSDLSGYLPKSGGTLTGEKRTATPLILDTNVSSITQHLRVNNVNKAEIGWHSTTGAYIYNYASAKALGIKDDGTPHYNGNTIWHAGNDGSGSGLDADTLDGLHASQLMRFIGAGITGIDINDTLGNAIIYYGGTDNPINPSETRYGAILQWSNTAKWYPSDTQSSASWYYQLIGATTSIGGGLYFRRRTNGKNWTTSKEIAFTDSNVASATKLQTPRTIWGRSFDGTANIDGLFTLLDTDRDSRPFKIRWLLYNERAALNMWSYSSSHGGFGDMCLGVSSDAVSQGSLYFNSSTKQWGVGTASPEYKFEVNGNISSRATTNVIRKFVVENNVAKASFYAATSGMVGIFEELLGQWLIVNNGGNTGLAIGNVGVGTLSPTYKLEVRGDIYSSTNVRTPIATIGGIPIYKSQDDVLYIDGNLVVRGGVTMYAENEVDIPSIIDSLPIASNTALGIASFDSTYFSVDSNGMVSLTSAPSSGASSLGELLNVDASIDATASVDRILYQPQGSSMWTWRELPKDGVVGNYLPLSGGQMTGGIGTILNPKGYAIYTPVAGSFTFTSADDFATKASFIGSMRSLANNNWFVGISARHANIDSSGGGDGTQYGMYLIANMEGAGIDFNNISLQWNLQGRGVWGSTRFILDSLNWRTYITEDGTLMINGGNSSGSFPALKFHIPGVNWSQFLMASDGTVWLVGGASQSAERVGLAIGGLNCLSVLSHGGITMYSDQRKKTILNHVELSLKQIADAPLIEHYYNSDQDKTTHVGSIAQYWASMNDWFCKLDNEGFYTMEIQNCALASAISIARHLEKYESKTDKKIRMLKKRITELEDKLEKLEGGNYGCR